MGSIGAGRAGAANDHAELLLLLDECREKPGPRHAAPEAEVCGNRVMPCLTPGMAAQQPPTGQRTATPGALLLQGLQRKGRTGGLEATGIAQPRPE